MKHKLLTALSAVLLAGSMGANAGFVASYGSGKPSSTIGGTFTSDMEVFQVSHPAYFLQDTTPSSIWVWGEDPDENATINFTFTFDLTGYDLETAALTGEWGADNIGSISLNGHVISSFTEVIIDNFYYAWPFSTDNGSLFNQGVNNLVFSITNTGFAGAFRSGGAVYAEPGPERDLNNQAAVSAPATFTLAGLGLAGLGLSRRRKA